MTQINLDTSRDIATVPLTTRVLRSVDTPAGPATETSRGWYVAPYASLINVNGVLKSNPITVENAVAVQSGRHWLVDRAPQGHELVHDGNRSEDQGGITDYWGSFPDRITERYLSTTFFSTGYEKDAFIFGGMGEDRVMQLSNAPTISTNEAGMAKWTTPNGSEQITFGVEEVTFLDETFSVNGLANRYEWEYNLTPGNTFRVAQFNELGDLSSRNAIDFAYVHTELGDWTSRATRVGSQWYVIEPGKTTAVSVPEFLIGQDTGYQFSSTGELLGEIPWSTTESTFTLNPAPAPTPETGFPVAPAPTAPAQPSAGGNTINITINGDNNTIGDIFIGVKNGRDKLTGTEGDDLLTSNRGRDVLTGGDGADDFVIAGDGRDKVRDYDEAEGDSLAVDEALVEGIDTELIISDTAREFRAERADALVYREDVGKLYSDGDFLAKLNGSPELSAVDIV